MAGEPEAMRLCLSDRLHAITETAARALADEAALAATVSGRCRALILRERGNGVAFVSTSERLASSLTGTDREEARVDLRAWLAALRALSHHESTARRERAREACRPPHQARHGKQLSR